MTSAKSLPVAIAQFTVAEEPERNLEIIDGFARDAAAGGAKLLALPEGLIARRGDDDSYAAAHAQPLDGPFVDGLRRISAQRHIVLMGTVHVAPEQVRDADSRVSNTFLVIRDGEIIAEYRSCIFTMRSRPANPTWFSQEMRCRLSSILTVGKSAS